jgi:hypothetical protein
MITGTPSQGNSSAISSPATEPPATMPTPPPPGVGATCEERPFGCCINPSLPARRMMNHVVKNETSAAMAAMARPSVGMGAPGDTPQSGNGASGGSATPSLAVSKDLAAPSPRNCFLPRQGGEGARCTSRELHLPLGGGESEILGLAFAKP